MYTPVVFPFLQLTAIFMVPFAIYMYENTLKKRIDDLQDKIKEYEENRKEIELELLTLRKCLQSSVCIIDSAVALIED